MSDFYKKFLLEDIRRLNPNSGRQVFLAAFGKHPGWDDHVEDLGLETDSLNLAKILLYVQGIGGEIDSGAWEKLEPAQQLPSFKHIFFWHRAGRCIIGRMWSSSDGKGRTRYPMVVCVQCAGLPLGWTLDQVLPRLEEIERACLQTKSAADVRSLLDRLRGELRSAMSNIGTDPGSPAVSPAALARFVSHPSLGPDQEGWCRVLHQMQSQMTAFAPGRFSLKGDLSAIRPQQIRLPPCGETMTHTILLWTKFFLSQVDSAVPLLFTVPLNEPWLDVTLGEPTPHELFCLRASPKAVPLASEVPYNLEPGFKERTQKLLTSFQQSGGEGPAKMAPAPVQKEGGSSTTQKWFKWLGGGAALLVVALTSILLLNRASRPAASPAAAPKVAVAQPPISGRPLIDGKVRIQAAAAEQALLAQAEARRLTEEKRAAEERARLEATARESARIQAEAEARERQRAALAKAEAARAAEQKPVAVAPAVESTPKQAPIPPPEVKPASNVRIVAAANPSPTLPPKAALGSTMAPTGKPGQITNSIGMVLILIPSGYWVGKYEVTQEQYFRVMESNPSLSRAKLQPVENVNWNEAMDFCRRLTGLETRAGTLPAGAIYTLPTEKQWEEFRAEATFAGAVTSQKDKRYTAAVVGSGSMPNRLGLFDVVGNVWEWCADPVDSSERLLKGGAFNSLTTFHYQKLLETTPRRMPATSKAGDAGFRCILLTQS